MLDVFLVLLLWTCQFLLIEIFLWTVLRHFFARWPLPNILFVTYWLLRKLERDPLPRKILIRVSGSSIGSFSFHASRLTSITHLILEVADRCAIPYELFYLVNSTTGRYLQYDRLLDECFRGKCGHVRLCWRGLAGGGPKRKVGPRFHVSPDGFLGAFSPSRWPCLNCFFLPVVT
jgi:hypothetical protein